MKQRFFFGVLLLWLVADATRLSADSAKFSEPLRTNPESIKTQTTNEPPASVPEHLRHGYQLAHVYCQACHLYPEPQFLTKDAWANGALRMMALRVGAARLNYERVPDGAILKAAGIFPAEPLLSEPDWRAICQFYVESAPAHPLPQPPHPPLQPAPAPFRTHEIRTSGGQAWTTLVKIDPTHHRLYLGDAKRRTLDILDSTGHRLQEIQLESGPVRLAFANDGLYALLIGNIFPSDELAGKVAFLQLTNGQYTVRTVLDHLRRPTDLVLADLNQDGREDVIVTEFGHNLGQFSWFENLGGNRFAPHPLFDRPGAERVEVVDLTGQGRPDLLVQMAQAREGVYWFRNRGRGEFDLSPIAEYPPVWGSTDFQVVDFNHDGHPDLLVVNGDSGDYVSPPKNFHGVRLYLNDGNNHFQEAWFYPMHGACHAVAADFNGDGNLDIVAAAFYPDYLDSSEASFVYLENKGDLKFEAHTIPQHLEGRWLTMDVADLDGDGDLDIVLGSFVNGPASVPIPMELRRAWGTNQVAALLLENTWKSKGGQ